MYVKEIWKMTNLWFEGKPVALVLALLSMFLIFRVIPHMWKWWRGELKKDKDEREKSRASISSIETTVETQTGKLTKIESHLGEINGNFQKHVNNRGIHTPKVELVTSELFINETKHINDSIEAIFTKLDK